MDPIKSGTHYHFKGGTYVVMCVAHTHNHNGDFDVVYFSIAHNAYNTRPLVRDSRNEDSWLDIVEWPDGVKRTRFVACDGLSKEDLMNLHQIWTDKKEIPPL